MSVRTCAAITLDETGGGVAAVARLIWDGFQARWAGDARLVTLWPTAPAPFDAVPDVPSRLSFGSKLAVSQALGESAWVFYTHLALAQVQRYIPSGLQRRYAIFLHGIEVWRPLTKAQRSVIEGARLLVANSSYTARRAAEMHPWLPPVTVCGLALPQDEDRQDAAARASRQHARPTVLIVGRMASAERYKGHDQLIDAWPTVLRAYPSARLIIAGEGDDRARLQEKARVVAGHGAVEFTGFVNAAELERLYQDADVFAMPSRNEGFGLVYLEAMRHALPCIGSTEDAAGEIIQDGVTGVLVRQDDVESLGTHLVRLLGDDGMRARMGEAGRERARARFGRREFNGRLMSAIDGAFEAPVGQSPGSGVSGVVRGRW